VPQAETKVGLLEREREAVGRHMTEHTTGVLGRYGRYLWAAPGRKRLS